MKKLLAILLVMTLVLSSMSVAFAGSHGSVPNEGTTESKDINVIVYPQVANGQVIYRIDVAWGNLDFRYDIGNQGVWLPNEHKYDDTTGAKWVNSSANVSVTNHSNAAVNVKAELPTDAVVADLVAEYGIELNLTDITTGSAVAANVNATLENDATNIGDCPVRIFKVEVEGTPKNIPDDQTAHNVSNIKVTISKPTP